MVFRLTLNNAVRDDEPFLVAHHGVLHAADGEFFQAIDEQALEIFLCFSTFDRDGAGARQSSMGVASTFPRCTLGLPSIEFPGPHDGQPGPEAIRVVEYMIRIKCMRQGCTEFGVHDQVPKIVRALPAEDGEYRYRIESVYEPL